MSEECKSENTKECVKYLGKCIISVAPMLDVTNIHFRSLCRIISKYTELWTEMVVSDTIIHCYNDESRRHLLENEYLKTNDYENPLVLQLGGNCPHKIRKSIEISYKYGFRNFNLNIGCPSVKVASDGNFGASLFKYPFRVARIVNEANKTLKELGCNTKLSIKTRIGVDEFDSYKHLFNFISIVSGKNINNLNKKEFLDIFPSDIFNDHELVDYEGSNYIGSDTFIIHSRKAWLNGINPSKNRRIPELKYSWVYRLTVDFPELDFHINGGITSINQAISLLNGDWFLNNSKNENYGNKREYKPNNNKKSNTECFNINNTGIENNCLERDSFNCDDNVESKTNTKYENELTNKDSIEFKDEHEDANYRKVIQKLIFENKWNNIKGVMIGREVMNNPFITLSNSDKLIYNKDRDKEGFITRRQVLNKYIEYLKDIKPKNKDNKYTTGELYTCLNPVFGLFYGLSGTKYWRKILSENIKNIKSNESNHFKSPHQILEESIKLFEDKYSNLLDIPSSEYM